MLENKSVYVCSPLNAPTETEKKENMRMARWYMEQISRTYHCRAFAPHAYLPELLDDSQPKERAIALSFGMELLAICDALVICGNRISPGMGKEIQAAQETRKEILQYCQRDGQWTLISNKKAAGL